MKEKIKNPLEEMKFANEKLKSENDQMKVMITNASAQLKAQKLTIDDLMQANVALKANSLLLEEHIKNKVE